MAAETEQLVILLEARIRDFEKNLQKAYATAGREFGNIERRAKDSAKRVEESFAKIGEGLQGRLSGIGGLLNGGDLSALGEVIGTGGILGTAIGVASGAVATYAAIAKSVADMADDAARINLPVEDFQALEFSAHQSGVETAKMTDLFQVFNRSIGEANSKGGDLANLLQANGIAITDANGKIRDTKALFYEVVNLIKNTRSEQEAASIAQTAFGRGAMDALPWLQQGAAAIKEQEQAARDSGAVIDKELVARAAEFDDKWTAVWDTFKARGKSAVLEIGTTLADLIKQSQGWMQQLGNADVFKRINKTFGVPELVGTNILSPEGQWTIDLIKTQHQLDDLLKKRGELQEQIDTATGRRLAALQQDLANVDQHIAATRMELKTLEGEAHFGDTGQGRVKATPFTDARDTIIPQKLDGAGDKLTGSARELANAAEKLKTVADGFGTGWLMPGFQGPMDPRQSLAIAESAQRGVLQYIRATEGTAGPNGYNVSLANGAFLPGGREQPLTTLTLDQIDQLQTFMLHNPANHYNSSAVGAYQIVRDTLRDLRGQLGLSGDTMFSPDLQDKLAEVLLQQRGHDFNSAKGIWQGLADRGSEAQWNIALGASSNQLKSGTDALNARQKATDQLIASQQRENQSLQLETMLVGRGTYEAEKARKEAELLNQAKQAGIPITDQVKASISQLADEYARGKAKRRHHDACRLLIAEPFAHKIILRGIPCLGKSWIVSIRICCAHQSASQQTDSKHHSNIHCAPHPLSVAAIIDGPR